MKCSLLINIFLIVCLPTASICLDDFASGACHVEDLACEIHSDNLVLSVPGVGTVEECRQLCYEGDTCGYFSYFGSQSFPITNFCVLISDCPTLHQCEDCVSEERFCFTTCGDDVEGTMGENIVEMLVDVTDELQCKFNCKNNTDCKFYTYHNASDPNYPELCFLLTEVKEPLVTCQHCSTGSARCASETVCGFQDSASQSDWLSAHIMFTDTSTTHQVRTVRVGMCEVEILGIGGGGKGRPDISNSNIYGGGGGSGHPLFTSHLPHRSTKLLVKVGNYGQPSLVTTEAGLSVLVAPPGEDGEESSYDGVSGYSGGGGDGEDSVGTGGSNGGDGMAGSNGRGGKGSGVDISEFEMETFGLKPGDGGLGSCGGGGGGILINNKGPDTFYNGMGEGYGGGGEGCGHSSRYGASGAILMGIRN